MQWYKCFIASVLNLLSAATMLTTMEVLVDELWTRTVERTPIITPQIGLLRSSLLRNTSPAALPKHGVETLLRMVFLIVMLIFRFNRIHDNTSSRLVLLTGYPPPRSYPVYDLKEINMLNKFLFLLFPLQWIYLRGVWKLSSGNPGSRRRRRGPWGTEEPGWWSTGRARSFHWCSALLTTTWNVHGFIYITKKNLENSS